MGAANNATEGTQCTDEDSSASCLLPEQQEEELSCLKSIFMHEGEMEVLSEIPPVRIAFRIPDPELDLDTDALAKVNAGQMKLAESHVFFLRVEWPSGYPEELPEIFLDDPRNDNLQKMNASERILETAKAEATDMLGEQSTFTIVQAVKDTAHSKLGLLEELNRCGKSLWEEATTSPDGNRSSALVASDGKQERSVLFQRGNEKLTKTQKRSLLKHAGTDGVPTRGWNWVDIISHLNKGPILIPKTTA